MSSPISALFYIVDYQIHKPAVSGGNADTYRRPPQRALISATEQNNSVLYNVLLANITLQGGEAVDILRVYPTPEVGAMPYFSGVAF